MVRSLILALSLVALLVAWPSSALAVSFDVVVEGGSAIQRQRVYEVVSSCRVHAPHLVTVKIVRDIPDVHFRVAAVSELGTIRVKGAFDNLRPGEKRVRWEWGEDSPIFRDVICHEYAHQVFDALPADARERWRLSHFQLPGWPHPCEAFAENFRLTMYPPELLWRTTTVSPYPMLSAAEMREWLRRFSSEELASEERPPY